MKSHWANLLRSQSLHFFTGASLTLLLVQLATVWSTVCGVSSESLTALFLAGGIALMADCVFVKPSVAVSKFSLLISASAIVVLSVSLSSGLNAALNLSVTLFGDSPRMCFAVPGLMIGAAILALQCWLRGVVKSDTTGAPHLTVVMGLAAGLLFPIIHAALVFPVAVSVVVTVVVTTIVGAITARPEEKSSAPLTSSPLGTVSLRPMIATVGLAIFLHSATRFIAGLMPVTFVLLMPALVLCVFFWKLMSHMRLERWFRNSRVVIVAMVFPVVVPLAFHSLVEWNLKLNATVDSVVLICAARSLQLATIWCVGLFVWKAVNRVSATAPLPRSLVFAWGCLALAIATILSSVGVSVPICMAIGVLCMALAVFGKEVVDGDTAQEPSLLISHSRRAFLAGVIGVILIAILPSNSGSATQLLFNARASHGFRAGLDTEVINQSTAFRLVSAEYSKQGYLTAWSTSGDQMQLRLDGIPLGQVSANTQTAPQPIVESLPVLLPLVMHKNASSVLLLGDETGVGLRVCSDFPVHTVVASRPNSTTTAFASKYTWRSMVTSPLEDERFHIKTEPAALTVRHPKRPGDRFDVVVANSPNPVSLSSLEQFTPEFYTAVRNQLTDDGVFCQRITRHDLGAAPIFRMISSLADTFGRIVMLHMAEGEIAVVAGVQPDSLLDKGLLTRMQRDHVGRALSISGWDWSQVAALPIIDTNDPVGIFEHQSKLASASSTNAHFAFAIPLQAAAWNDKSGEMRQSFAPHQQRLADAGSRGPGYNEFAIRFSAVVQQAEILANFPDQPWPYRRSLKTEMQRNPRPPIEVSRYGKIERMADPRDNRRKDYFVSLGNVLQQAKNGTVDPLALRELTHFTAEYEPLLSYFAHHELVKIHEAAGHPSPAAELRHRLHTVYFSSGNDFSVRLVTDVMQQILDDPELVADDATRFDYLNSMLQELVRRWEMRRNYEPPSARQTQQEIDTCVAVSKRALDAMQQWSGTIGVTQEQMLARRKFINRGLISPLRTYHDRVLVHRLKNEAPLTLDPDGDSSDLPMLINPADALTN